ncbi:uncharacterized protein [Euwallacea similis]|uniref:uncharacterized protein n=1 Tax=Euwallacea similis TaxID=1736056 RepID=UPI0034502EAC
MRRTPNKGYPDDGNANNYQRSYHKTYSYHKNYHVSQGRFQRDYWRRSHSWGIHNGYSSNAPTRGRFLRNSHSKSASWNSIAQSRSASPVEGSEEFMTRKIEHTSALIMRHLLTPNEPLQIICPSTNEEQNQPAANINKNCVKAASNGLNNMKNNINKTKPMNVTTKQMYEKIVNHIVNLNEGRMKNFVNAKSSTNWDEAINHMQKQKRLEISRVLRDMSSSLQGGDDCGSICSDGLIVPDIGIKIEDLPLDVIEELRQTLNLDLENLDKEIADTANSHDSGNNVIRMPALDVELTRLDTLTINCIEKNLVTVPNDLEDKVPGPYCPNVASQEPLNSNPNPYNVKKEAYEIVEIKLEDIQDDPDRSSTVSPNVVDSISDIKSETQLGDDHLDCNVFNSLRNESIDIKEEDTFESNPLSSADLQHRTFSEETVICPLKNNSCAQQKEESQISRLVETEPEELNNISLTQLESIIQRTISQDKNTDCTDLDALMEKSDLIDTCIQHLTNYRKEFMNSARHKNYSSTNSDTGVTSIDENSFFLSQKRSQTAEDKRVLKKRKTLDDGYHTEFAEDIKFELDIEEKILSFSDITDKITTIEAVANELVLGTDTGYVHFVSLRDGTKIESIEASDCTVTSLKYVKRVGGFNHMYIGSLNGVVRVFDLKRRKLLVTSYIHDQIRCMDSAWHYVFLGCKNGSLVRLGCKSLEIEFEEQTGKEILVIKASQEGPRQVLLIGHRNAPIFVRDAFSGLFLRQFSDDAIAPTVYSLTLHKSHIYCGTSKDNVLVFSFHDGKLIKRIVADKFKGVTCMIVRKNFLFVGCYNGFVYVYNLDNNQLEATLTGSGGSITCMQVLTKQVIVGTLAGKIKSIPFPNNLWT